MYSKDSALNKIEDLNERKIKAAVKAGLDPETPEIKYMMELKEERVRVEIVNFLNRNNPNDYIKLISDQQLFWSLQARLVKALDDDDNLDLLLKISERSEELIERIKKFKQRVYEEPALIEEAEKIIRMVSPEQRLKEKKNTA